MEAGPEDFSDRSNPNGKQVHFFLDAFGQTNREASERSNDGEITQAILLMNSPFVLDQIKAKDGSYLADFSKQDLTEEEGFAVVQTLSDAESDAR